MLLNIYELCPNSLGENMLFLWAQMKLHLQQDLGTVRHFVSKERLREICFIRYRLHHLQCCQISDSCNTNFSSNLT
jgi:hypothetical protein